jgi:hypothetical protein
MSEDFELYDVPTTCRECLKEWVGKAFKPADDKKRWGTCAACLALLDAPKLPHPPKDEDLQPPRRTWEPD